MAVGAPPGVPDEARPLGAIKTNLVMKNSGEHHRAARDTKTMGMDYRLTREWYVRVQTGTVLEVIYWIYYRTENLKLKVRRIMLAIFGVEYLLSLN